MSPQGYTIYNVGEIIHLQTIDPKFLGHPSGEPKFCRVLQ